ncbi:hypothetical protein ATY37_15910 [Vibrio cidicii]|uniref:Uncharacterized protein n=1 Tax=Vibrio cidicii TaxID=1763883 RepID=A0A151KX58_9VIBR|nr:hypothetical protein ATY37_15910 [Vibrio cidicii]MBE3668024.1 hypothetical protein [Vibrio navarrensis]MBE4591679.1 hypothetical protein [Vibrio navarrensis]
MPRNVGTIKAIRRRIYDNTYNELHAVTNQFQKLQQSRYNKIMTKQKVLDHLSRHDLTAKHAFKTKY